jgi:hypothetical protein
MIRVSKNSHRPRQKELIRLTDLIERQPNWNARGRAMRPGCKSPEDRQACRAAILAAAQEKLAGRPGLNRVGGFISIQER